VALAEHATDPQTWQAPLAKALAASGAGADLPIIEAAQQLMALLDQAGTTQGKYRVDLRGAQGTLIGDGGQQYNTFNSVTFPVPEIQPGQPRNEAAFGEAFEAAGGRARLGRALGEAHEDGPGWVQHFDGGGTGRAVICAIFGHSATVVDHEVWNELGRLGRGTHPSGTAAVGFPVPDGDRPLIAAEDGPVRLEGGAWGRGRLVPAESGGWQWQPEAAFDSEACHDRDSGAFRHGEMDLRLRLAARIPLVAAGLRVTEAGRASMLATLRPTGLTGLMAALATRYGLEPADITWQETLEPEGRNTSRVATYELVVPGAEGRPALLGSLWFMPPGGRSTDVRAIVDLCVDFDAIQPGTGSTTPAQIPPGLRVTLGELISFFSSAWQAAEALVLTTGKQPVDMPPAGAPRLELYVQNLHPEHSGGPRTLRTLDLVDLSIFGRTRNGYLRDLSVGVTTPLGLNAEEIGSVVRRALIWMANDSGFVAADAARI